MGLAPAPLFLFGTLRDAAHLEIVGGRPLATKPCTAPGYEVRVSAEAQLPLLTRVSEGSADGLLVDTCPLEARDRLDFYRRVYGYDLEPIEIMQDGQRISAVADRPRPRRFHATKQLWSLAEWQDTAGPVMREAAREIMRMSLEFSPEEVAERLDVIHTRAQARLNAMEHPTASRFGSGFSADDVDIESHDIAFSGFFSVERARLRHRTFAGPMSARMNREVFMAADAVTVLPYDPKTDQVMLIEQFRAPALFRGDPKPWQVEAIAGRLDPGETPPQTARREAREEAGLDLGELHFIGGYYTAPGATSEYIYSYVAECDLAQAIEGLGGLDSEAEDIRRMLITYEDFETALLAGEITVGPLLISAMWLQRERGRLRDASGV